MGKRDEKREEGREEFIAIYSTRIHMYMYYTCMYTDHECLLVSKPELAILQSKSDKGKQSMQQQSK